MFIKLHTGRRRGEVVEMHYADARPLLDDGRATLIEMDTAPPVAPVSPQAAIPAAPPVPSVLKGKKGKKR